MTHLSARDLIILAAYRACGGHDDASFSANDLAVLAFRLAPERFAMRGYPHYPDSQRVKCQLARASLGNKNKGVLARGWLVRIAPDRYRVTVEGMERGRELDDLRREAKAS